MKPMYTNVVHDFSVVKVIEKLFVSYKIYYMNI